MGQQTQTEKKCYLGHDGELVLGVGAQPGDADAALCAPCAESWTLFAQGCLEQLKMEGGFNTAFAEWAEGVRRATEAIPARDVALGQWYVVPSGEIERAHALRGVRGQAQAGFLHVGGNPNDPEDTRWLDGDIQVTPASDQEVEDWKRASARKWEPTVSAEVVVGSFGLTLDDLFRRVDSFTAAPADARQEITGDEPLIAVATSHKLSPLFSSESGEWQTSPDDFAWLNAWAQSRWGSNFVLDVCASRENALCNAYFTREHSCLTQPTWFGPWYMNPPYGDPEYPCKVPRERCRKKTCEKRGAHNDVYIPGICDFVLAGRKQAQAGHPGMCLLPYRPDTEWWRLGVLAPDGEQVAMGGDWAQGWSWVRWSSGLLVETRLISGRLSFVRPGGGESWTAPFPSVVVVFDRWK